MRYLPKSPSERRGMLDAIGVATVEDLFKTIPEKFRLRDPLELPGPLSETEIIQYFQARAAENSRGYTSFLGAGVYNHLRSVVTDALMTTRMNSMWSYTIFFVVMGRRGRYGRPSCQIEVAIYLAGGRLRLRT